MAELEFRFQWYMKGKNRVIGWMPRKDWEKLRVLSTGFIEIEPEQTPLVGIAEEGSFLAMGAARLSSETCRVTLYRHDQQDKPYDVNLDTYLVLEDILGSSDYPLLIEKSSTSDSPPLRDFLDNYVAFVSESPSTGHWLTTAEAPLYVRMKIEEASSQES